VEPLKNNIDLPVRDAAAAPVRYDFLDGIRGLAAFYVVYHHLYQIYLTDPVQPQAGYYWYMPVLAFGHHAVAVFIVLSGFCLMMPVAKSANGVLRENFMQYMWRRTRRIVPAYYAAIAMTLLLVAFIPAMRRADGEFWSAAFGPNPSDWHSFFDVQNLVAHLLVLHSLREEWVMRIDPPMWSIGVEWLNYFLMPLLFIPIWRRWGNLALMVFATVFCFLPYLTRPVLKTNEFTFHWMQPWFISLFAVGMAAASLQFARAGRAMTRTDLLLRRIALHPITMIGLIGAAVAFHRYRVPTDFVTGALTVCVILHCASHTALGRRARVLLEWRVALWLGMISYSLYLFHGPLLQLAHRVMGPLGLSAAGRFAMMCLAVVPVIIAISWVCYRLFEKPFLARARKAAVVKGAEEVRSSQGVVAATVG